VFKKYCGFLGWTLVLGASLYFVVNTISLYFVGKGFSEDMIPFKPSFLVHIIGGTIMISFGPLQFIPKIRRGYPKVHRFVGRVYVFSVFITGMFAIYIAVAKIIITERHITFGTGLIGLALSSLLTTLTAFWMIRNKYYEQHREWMIRSYVATLGFTTFRLFLGILNGVPFHVEGLEGANIMAWACWSVPLLITEVILQLNRAARQMDATRISH